MAAQNPGHVRIHYVEHLILHVSTVQFLELGQIAHVFVMRIGRVHHVNKRWHVRQIRVLEES